MDWVGAGGGGTYMCMQDGNEGGGQEGLAGWVAGSHDFSRVATSSKVHSLSIAYFDFSMFCVLMSFFFLYTPFLWRLEGGRWMVGFPPFPPPPRFRKHLYIYIPIFAFIIIVPHVCFLFLSLL